jgi:hypothetical protein
VQKSIRVIEKNTEKRVAATYLKTTISENDNNQFAVESTPLVEYCLLVLLPPSPRPLSPLASNCLLSLTHGPCISQLTIWISGLLATADITDSRPLAESATLRRRNVVSTAFLPPLAVLKLRSAPLSPHLYVWLKLAKTETQSE